MKKYYVYKLQIEGEDFPFYIGKGSGTRMLHHFMPYELKKKTHKSFKILKAIRNGIKILTIVIEDNLSEHEAFELESSLVRQYGRLDNNTGILVNKCDGGKGSPKVKVSNNTRAKLSEVSKRRIVTTKTRERLSAANIGKIVVFDVETGKHIRIAVQDYKDNRARYSTVLDRRNALGIKPTLGMKHNGWKLSDVTKNKHAIIGWNKRPEIWKNAQGYYSLYCTLTKKNAYQLGKLTGIPDSYFGAMVGRFNDGWIPADDDLWCDWMCHHNFVI